MASNQKLNEVLEEARELNTNKILCSNGVLMEETIWDICPHLGIAPKANGRDLDKLHYYVPPRAVVSCERLMGNELLPLNNKWLFLISFHDSSSVAGYRK